MGKANDWKERSGVVYSTNREFSYEASTSGDQPEIPPGKQDLRVQLDKKQRRGKSVTLVTGFIGKDADLQELSRMLKTKLGVGGSAKNGEIVIQGDFCQKVMELLIQKGFKVKKSGG